MRFGLNQVGFCFIEIHVERSYARLKEAPWPPLGQRQRFSETGASGSVDKVVVGAWLALCVAVHRLSLYWGALCSICWELEILPDRI